jgi:hypothetical protein
VTIRTRQQLIDRAVAGSVYGGIRRAAESGYVEVYGSFRYSSGGIIVHFKSQLGGQWDVFVDMQSGLYRVQVLTDDVPWGDWIGEDCENAIYRGDAPQGYKIRKELANAKK